MNTLPLPDLSLPRTATRGMTRRVNSFLLMSLLMHGGALLGLLVLGQKTSLPAARIAPNELQLIQLDAPQAVVAPANIHTTTRSTSATRPPHRDVLSTPTLNATADIPTPAAQPPATESAVAHNITTADATAPEPASSEATATPAQSLAETKALILSYLHLTLDLQKIYPPLAYRFGWQGDVLLAFHVDPNGAIQNVHVTHSSGYAVLDQSAVNALRRVGNIPNAPHWLGGGMTDLELPVSYQLREG